MNSQAKLTITDKLQSSTKTEQSSQRTVPKPQTQRTNLSSMDLVFTFIELEEKGKIQDTKYCYIYKGLLGKRSKARPRQVDSPKLIHV